MSYPLRTAAAVTALGLTGAAIWSFSGSSDTEADQKTVTLGRIATVALTTQHNCDDLLKYYRTQASRVVGPYGLDGGPQLLEAATSDAAGKISAPGAVEDSGAARSAAGAPDSATNVQVAGVDESDIVKTDGDLMVSVINGGVRITRLAGAETKTLATWQPAEGVAQSLFLDGDTAVIIGDRSGGIPLGATKMRSPGGYSAAVTDLTVLDLADPANPRPVRRIEIDGTRSGEARLVDGEIRLALTAGTSGITWEQPAYPDVMQESDEAQAKFEKAEKRSLVANKRLIAKSTIENWIPQATVTPLNAKGAPSGPAVSRPLLECEQVAIPGSFSGLRTLALVSMDLKGDTPLTTWRSAGVIADGSTVYATADHAWLATSRWNVLPIEGGAIASRFAPSAANTQIHRFDTPLREQPKYIASGEIPGSLLSQFSMDEKDGMLRVASTTEGEVSPDFPVEEPALPSDSPASSSADPSGTTATQVAPDSAAGGGTTGSTGSAGTTAGSAGAAGATAGTTEGSAGSTGPTDESPATDVAKPSAGLPATVAPAEPQPDAGPAGKPAAKTKPKPSEGRVTVLKVDGNRLTQVGVVTGLGVGERIQGVRFIGDVGYVVTYRQTDPLYTVDLSDPAQPKVRGELAVLGYSAYLHPAGDGRLLGLGQDGTKSGNVTGLQLSLFDVSNLDSPRRLDRTRMAGAWSDAEGDHHAFTMAGDLVLIPYSSWSSVEGKDDSETELKDGPYLQRFDAGVIAVRVGADGLGTPTTLRMIGNGTVTFDGSREISPSAQRMMAATPMRTVIHDGTIYTLTSAGVAAHSATDFTRLAQS